MPARLPPAAGTRSWHEPEEKLPEVRGQIGSAALPRVSSQQVAAEDGRTVTAVTIMRTLWMGPQRENSRLTSASEKPGGKGPANTALILVRLAHSCSATHATQPQRVAQHLFWFFLFLGLFLQVLCYKRTASMNTSSGRFSPSHGSAPDEVSTSPGSPRVTRTAAQRGRRDSPEF